MWKVDNSSLKEFPTPDKLFFESIEEAWHMLACAPNIAFALLGLENIAHQHL
jgi:hypothetical protein